MKHATASAMKMVQNQPEITGRYVVRARELLSADLPSVVCDIAKLFDGRRDVAEVAAKAQISVVHVSAVVRKLTAMGVLQLRITHGTTTAKSQISSENHFSDLEEGFFSAEIGPIDECDEPFPSWGDRIRGAVAEMMVRFRSEKALG